MLLNESLLNEGFPPPTHTRSQGQADYYADFVKETINFCQIYKDNGCSPQILLYQIQYI